MKRFLCYFTTMLLVFAVTDMCLGGALLRGFPNPYGMSAGIGGIIEEPQKTKDSNGNAIDESKELGILIEAKSYDFVRAAFNRDKAAIAEMLSEDAEYIVAGDNSSFIRYSSGDFHVEGYMATDKKLVQVRQNWYVTEDDGTITSGVEVMIEGEKTFQVWYIHYEKTMGQWKIFMLENGV